MKQKAMYRFVLIALLVGLFQACPAFADDASNTAAHAADDGGRTASVSVPALFADAEAVLVPALSRQDARIDVSALNCPLDEWSGVYFDVLHAHPELFYVDAECDYTYRENSGTVMYVAPTYRYSGDALADRISAFNAATDAILASIPAGLAPLEQALYVNDLLCVNYAYDDSSPRYSADDLLLEGSGACDAYTKTYMHILRRLGVNVAYAYSEPMRHSWAQVELDGEWYNVDVGWNDPVPDLPGKAMHRYFLLSDAVLADDAHAHHDWSAAHAANSTKYDGSFWSDVDAPLVYLDGLWYYTPATYDGGNVYIRSWRASDGSIADVFKYNTHWRLWGEQKKEWLGAYAGLSARDGKLIYSTATQIWSVNPDGTGDARLLKLSDAAPGYIYSLFPYNGRTCYTLSTSPDEAGDVYALP